MVIDNNVIDKINGNADNKNAIIDSTVTVKKARIKNTMGKGGNRNSRSGKRKPTSRDVWKNQMREQGYIDFKEASVYMNVTISTTRKFIASYPVKTVKQHNVIMIDKESFRTCLKQREADKYVKVQSETGSDRALERRRMRMDAIENKLKTDEWVLMPAAARQLQIDYRAILNMVKNKRIESKGFGFDERRVRICDIVDYINYTNTHVSFGKPAFKAFKDNGERFISNGGLEEAAHYMSNNDKRRAGISIRKKNK